MKPFFAILLITPPLCSQSGPAKPVFAPAAVTASQNLAISSTQQYSRVFVNPLRDAWQQPDAIIAALALKSTETAAEFGLGAGYFGRRMALIAKQVYVIDSNKSVLNQASLEAPSNLTTILSDAKSLHLPPNSIDKLVINGLLELSLDNAALLAQIQVGLKPTAKIYLIDSFQSPTLPLPAQFAAPVITGTFQLFGFRLLQTLSIVSHQNVLVFGR
jgi:ubiquinone/menaquinone biosynthesis C-methylase UbiE